MQNGCDSGWETSNTEVSGINWSQDEKSVTEGMWMWNRPFIINMHEDLVPSDKYKENIDQKKVRISVMQ